MEAALSDYIARQPQANKLHPPSVDCRATVCRILTTVDVAVLNASRGATLDQTMGSLELESLGKELESASSMVTTSAEYPDKIGYVYFLRRASASANP